jgi:hypothetical protein
MKDAKVIFIRIYLQLIQNFVCSYCYIFDNSISTTP